MYRSSVVIRLSNQKAEPEVNNYGFPLSSTILALNEKLRLGSTNCTCFILLSPVVDLARRASLSHAKGYEIFFNVRICHGRFQFWSGLSCWKQALAISRILFCYRQTYAVRG